MGWPGYNKKTCFNGFQLPNSMLIYTEWSKKCLVRDNDRIFAPAASKVATETKKSDGGKKIRAMAENTNWLDESSSV
jgi:hypothetical protein